MSGSAVALTAPMSSRGARTMAQIAGEFKDPKAAPAPPEARPRMWLSEFGEMSEGRLGRLLDAAVCERGLSRADADGILDDWQELQAVFGEPIRPNGASVPAGHYRAWRGRAKRALLLLGVPAPERRAGEWSR